MLFTAILKFFMNKFRNIFVIIVKLVRCLMRKFDDSSLKFFLEFQFFNGILMINLDNDENGTVWMMINHTKNKLHNFKNFYSEKKTIQN